MKVVRIARDNRLSLTSGANHEMRVGDVSRSAGCQKQPDGGRTGAVERYKMRSRLPNRAREPNLSTGLPNRLCERSCRRRAFSSASALLSMVYRS
jgi:hypothetical protein